MMIRLCLAALIVAPAAFAETAPYAGQEERAISTLSAADIAAIQAGEGWGFAKPAELNGWPGPRHVLDAAEELGLTPAQAAEIQAIFDQMQAAAQAAGAAYLAAEAALDDAFRAAEATPEQIAALSAAAGAARAELRAVHLTAHLQTKPLLTRHQTHLYQRLRGYADGAASDGGHTGHGGHKQKN